MIWGDDDRETILSRAIERGLGADKSTGCFCSCFFPHIHTYSPHTCTHFFNGQPSAAARPANRPRYDDCAAEGRCRDSPCWRKKRNNPKNHFSPGREQASERDGWRRNREETASKPPAAAASAFSAPAAAAGNGPDPADALCALRAARAVCYAGRHARLPRLLGRSVPRADPHT
jgi:hypothetical protein